MCMLTDAADSEDPPRKSTNLPWILLGEHNAGSEAPWYTLEAMCDSARKKTSDRLGDLPTVQLAGVSSAAAACPVPATAPFHAAVARARTRPSMLLRGTSEMPEVGPVAAELRLAVVAESGLLTRALSR